MPAKQRRPVAIISGVLLLVVLAGWFIGRAAPTLERETVIFTENYSRDDPVANDIAVFADTIDLDTDVDGEALLVGEIVRVEGTFDGQLTVLGDVLEFEGRVADDFVILATAATLNGSVDGDVIVLAEKLSLADDLRVAGDLIVCTEIVEGEADITPCDGASVRRALGGAGEAVGLVALRSGAPIALAVQLPTLLMFTGIAVLVVVVFPGPIRNIENAVRANPRRMPQIGGLVFLLLVGVTAAFITVLAAVPPVGLILVPIYLGVLLIFGVLQLAGWVTLALLFGNWLVRRVTSRMLPPLVTTALGGLVLALLAFGLVLLPLGPLLSFLVFTVLGLAGLGGAYSTRLGLRSQILA